MKKSQLKEAIKNEIRSVLSLKEGVWSTGTVFQIQGFLRELKRLKDKYYNIVGSDDVFPSHDLCWFFFFIKI